MELKFDEIKALLPQTFPFLMVDKIISLEKGKRAVAIKNITGNEIFFLGHFPNLAVMPGAMIIESMAQTAIILFRKSSENVLADANTIFFFGAAKVRFFKPVFPGDQLQLEATVTKAISTAAIVEAVATVRGERVAKADLSFSVKRVDDFRGE